MPVGEFPLVGAVLDRDTTLRVGVGTTLVGDMTGHMISNRVNGVAGCAVAAGSTVVTVNSTEGMAAGDTVSIVGAGDIFDAVQLVHYAIVTAITSATTLSIDSPAATTVSASTLTYGVSGVTVNGGGTLDGNKAPTDGVNWDPIHYRLARNCVVSNLTIRNGDHSAVFLTEYSTGCSVTDCTLIDNGQPADILGAHVWAFQGSSNNVISNCEMSGGTYGVFIDDRTVGASIRDAPTNNNAVTNCNIHDLRIGVGVVGGSLNTVTGCTFTDISDYGAVIRDSTQGVSEFHLTFDNTLTSCAFVRCDTGIWIDNPNNDVTGNTFTDCGVDIWADY